MSEARRRAIIQAELDKAHSLKGWEIPLDCITICKHDDGSDWLLGHGGFGEVRLARLQHKQYVHSVKV